MKKIFKLASDLLTSAFILAACNMEPELHHNVDTNKASESADEVRNKLNGALNLFGDSPFFGRNMVLMGDLTSDIATVSPKSGHFLQVSSWTFSDENAEITDLWAWGYNVISNATNAIVDGEAYLKTVTNKIANDPNNADLLKEKQKIETTLSELYGLKAFSYFYLANIFAKAYSAEHATTLGLIIVPNDRVIKPKEKVSRATVEETWNFMLDLIKKAQSYNNTESSAFYITPKALKALEARIYLYMGKWNEAAEAAQLLIDAGVKPISDNEAYLAMWSSIAVNPEMIFAIAKRSDDNLSANSLNTFYNGYGGSLTRSGVSLITKTDVRNSLIKTVQGPGEDWVAPHPAKYDGAGGDKNVNNIYVIRASEVSLIAAEAYAQLGNVAKAQECLFEVAKRNAAITGADKLPADKDGLLKFIAEERVRELFCEGHRFFDLRRTQATAEIAGDKSFKPYNFVFPIPRAEMKAGYLDPNQQNNDWKDNLPIKK